MKKNTFLALLLVVSAFSCDDGNSKSNNTNNTTNNANNINNTNNTNNANCGNGALDAGEACDGSNLNGETCVSQGFSGGTLICNNTCTGFITTGCTNNTATCGNNNAEAGEACDGTDLNDETCVSQGFSGGTLICNNTCTGFITTGCTNNTGNGQVGDACSTPEDCADISGLTPDCMTSLGGFVTLPGGYCTATCTPGTPDPCATGGGVCVNVMLGSYCLKPCTDSSECREPDYTCAALPVGGDGATYCMPPMGGM